LSVKVFSPINVVEKDKWYDLPDGQTVYRFPISSLPARGIIELKAYEKSDTFVTFTNVTFLDSANVDISVHALLNLDTTSTRGHSSIVLEVPDNAVYFLIGATDPSYVRARAVKLEAFPPSTPIKYTVSQNITITNTANVALLGGGGAGGNSTTNTTSSRGGGGSGYLTHATISPGNYALTIGAGATTATSGMGPGGTTSFAGSNAAGGSSANTSDGANGGSGGGDCSNSYSTNVDGGFNGGNAGTAGGVGSGVTANLFIPGAGGAWRGGAGGLYGGGGGAVNTPSNQGIVSGVSALPGTGGGGGGSTSSVNIGNYPGGNGGSGALWVLES
jgi:hypothetical protein